MAEIITINVDFSNQERKLIIPERIEVNQFSVVQWNIRNFNRYVDFERDGLIFTLYFENESPFRWKRRFVQTGLYTLYPFRDSLIRLAEDSADEKGDFKYGVKVENAYSNETLFDEDPYLIVK